MPTYAYAWMASNCAYDRRTPKQRSAAELRNMLVKHGKRR